MASAQCRSSSTSTVGPTPTRRDTTDRMAAKVALWLWGAHPHEAGPAGQAHHPRQKGGQLWLPITAVSALSNAGATTAWPWSGGRPPPKRPGGAGKGRREWSRRRRRSARLEPERQSAAPGPDPSHEALAALLHQARLAEARLAHQDHDRARSFLSTSRGGVEHGELGLPPH